MSKKRSERLNGRAKLLTRQKGEANKKNAAFCLSYPGNSELLASTGTTQQAMERGGGRRWNRETTENYEDRKAELRFGKYREREQRDLWAGVSLDHVVISFFSFVLPQPNFSPAPSFSLRAFIFLRPSPISCRNSVCWLGVRSVGLRGQISKFSISKNLLLLPPCFCPPRFCFSASSLSSS